MQIKLDNQDIRTKLNFPWGNTFNRKKIKTIISYYNQGMNNIIFIFIFFIWQYLLNERVHSANLLKTFLFVLLPPSQSVLSVNFIISKDKI